MKPIIFYSSITLIALSAITCSKDTDGGDGEVKTMRVAEFIGVDSIDNLSDHIRIVNVCQPEFTDSSMLNRFIIGGVADGKIYLKSRGYDRESSWVTTYTYPEGKLIGAFNPHGAGPQELERGYDAVFSPDSGGTWTIFNGSFNCCDMARYSTDGRFITRKQIQNVESPEYFDGHEWLAVNNALNLNGGPHIVRERKVFCLSPDFEIIDSIPLQRRRWAPFATQLMDPIYSYGGNAYINDRDTIFRIDIKNRCLVPHIATILGDLNFDWGSIETYEELEPTRRDHLTPLNPVFNSRYAFVQYTLGDYDKDGTLSFDAYNLSDGSLAFRNKVPYGPETDWNAGTPLNIDGLTYRAWPTEFNKGDNLFFVISSDEVANVRGTDEANPIIVEVAFD